MNKRQIESEIILLNNRPLPQFLGLSPNQVHPLLFEPFSEASPVLLKSDISNETLDKIPFFRAAEDLINIIARDGKIKLTPLGALPKKVLVELYEKRQLLDYYIEKGMYKVGNEEYCICHKTLRMVMEISKLITKRNGVLTISNKLEKLLKPGKRSALFQEIFKTFTTKFNWPYNDGYTTAPLGQYGWAFTIYLLYKLGLDKKDRLTYGEHYLAAFPNFISVAEESLFTSKEKYVINCFIHRNFGYFLPWFGFVNQDMENFTKEGTVVANVALIREIFRIED